MKTFRTIRNKLLGVVLLTAFCVLFVAGGTILIFDINNYRAASINDMNTQIELLAFSTAPALQFSDENVAGQNLNLLRTRPLIRAAAVYNARGNLFASYVRENADFVFPVLPGDEGVSIDDSNLVIFRRIIENDEILGTAFIHSDYPINERVLNLIGILGIVAIGAMLVAFFLTMWLQSVITKPIHSIVEIANNVVSTKEYTQRAKKISEDEVGVLVDAFNEMLDEIENRTKALQISNQDLEQEIAERKRVRVEILRLNEELERKVLERTEQLQEINQELESFCYSVSHDLRGPLRSISGFSQALLEELPAKLPGECNRYLDKISAATIRMGQLIEDLLNLSRVSRGELARQDVDFSAMANGVILDLQNEAKNKKKEVSVSVWDGIKVNADPKLLRIVLENLLTNAWKFTSKVDNPIVEVGSMRDGEREVLFVRDNGAGFDMKYADKLFGAFQRLHGMDEYPGTGIGLATVHRVIRRHGGRVWCDSSVGNGAVFFFTLQHDKGINKSGNEDNAERDVGSGVKKMNPKLRSV